MSASLTPPPVLIIAEAGVNHNGSLELALRLVDAAQQAGADAVKFQLFRREEQVSKSAITAHYQRTSTGHDSMLEMARTYDLPWKDHERIFAHCRQSGIEYMASCFCPESAKFYQELGGRRHKVGSGEITNWPLLQAMARSGLPVLLSTGMSTWIDVAGAVDVLQKNGCAEIGILECVSSYPAEAGDYDLRAMVNMGHAFGTPYGLSDHTQGPELACAAAALGAVYIEKHFTIDRTLPGPDHSMSLSPDELAAFVSGIRNIERAVQGPGTKRVRPAEDENRFIARRGLVAAVPLLAGDRLTREVVTFKRPAKGIDPRCWESVEGRQLNRAVEQDEPILWSMLR